MGFIYLEIKSYGAVSPGATHLYGSLVWATKMGKDHQIHKFGYPLSESQAAELNKVEARSEFELKVFYQPGQMYSGFFSKDHLVERGRQVFSQLFDPTLDFLLVGSKATAEPLPVLIGDNKYAEVTNHLYLIGESLKWWDEPRKTPYGKFLREATDSWWELHCEVEKIMLERDKNRELFS